MNDGPYIRSSPVISSFPVPRPAQIASWQPIARSSVAVFTPSIASSDSRSRISEGEYGYPPASPCR
jgi:hypothetical protein